MKDMDKAHWPDRTSCMCTGRSLASFALQKVKLHNAENKRKDERNGHVLVNTGYARIAFNVGR